MKIVKKRLIITTGSILALLLATWFADFVFFSKKLYPGIKISHHSVGGLAISQVKDEVKKITSRSLSEKKPIKIVVGQKTETIINLSELGVDFKIDQTIQKAYQLGRTGNLKQRIETRVNAYHQKTNFLLDYTYDQELFKEKIGSLAATVFIPAIDPSIEIIKNHSADSSILVNPGQSGQKLDTNLAGSLLLKKIGNLDFSVLQLDPLVVSPALTEKEAIEIKKEAEMLIGKTITLTENGKTWTIEEEELISLLSPNGGFDRFKIDLYVSQLAESIDQPPTNASFQFANNRVSEFEPAKNGKTLDQIKTVESIASSLEKIKEKDSVTLELPVTLTPPAITTADVNNLGIEELIGRGESYFKGSIPSRIHNLTFASSKINGLLIAPNEVFSLNQELGEISKNTGYQEAYIIKEGKTILGDGGGVCQVSTTLFRAALNAGLPIVERQPHAYRVSYYEQGFSAGIDATVFSPRPDLKFKNDTPAHILIQTKVSPQEKKLTFDLYGTNDKRKTTISEVRIWNQAPPPPDLYQEDPNLPVGVTKQVEHAVWGAKTAFDWKVIRGEETLQEKTFYSSYKPWQAVYLVGTKQ